MNRSHENYDRRERGSDDAKKKREESLEALLVRMTEVASLEIETVAQVTTFVLERALNRLFELPYFGLCAALWPHFKIEVEEILHDSRETIDLVQALQEGAQSQSHREVLQLRGATSRITHGAAIVMDKALRLTHEIVLQSCQKVFDTDPDPEEDHMRAQMRPLYEHFLHNLQFMRLESLGMLQLFAESQDEKGHPTLLDVLAGCALQRAWVHAPEDHNLSSRNAQIALPPESAATAVLLSMTALERVQASLFNECLQTSTTTGDAVLSPHDAPDLFRSMAATIEEPRTRALLDIAAWSAPIWSYIDEQGNVVVSLLLPHQARMFERQISNELSKPMAEFAQAFKTLQLAPQCATRALEEGFEVAVTLPIPTLGALHKNRPITDRILEEHIAMTETSRARTNASSVTFLLKNNLKALNVQVARSLFEMQEEDSDEALPEAGRSLGLLADALQLSDVFDEATYLHVDGSQYLQVTIAGETLRIPGYLVTIGRETDVTPDTSTTAVLADISSDIDRFLKSPSHHSTRALDNPRALICRIPIYVVEDRACIDEITRLSRMVAIENLDLSFLRYTLQDETALSGARLLKNLRELFEIEGERLAEFERPRLHALPAEHTYQESASLHFYLSSSDGSLCGIGNLPLKGGIADLSVFPKSVATKCGQLVNAISTSMNEMQNTEGPWTSRLHQQLITKDFALSDEIVHELYQHRKGSRGELTSAMIAEVLFNRMAQAPSHFVISEQFSLTGRAPFILSILTPEDLERWTNQ